MQRRDFLRLAPALGFATSGPPLGRTQAAGLPPIPEPHFPGRLYQFVWRNWELANIERMAETVRAAPADLLKLGSAMGLPAKPTLTRDQLRRLYITVIRQNWHLLPNAQIRTLLGWDEERFRFILKEDDFLDHKLGPKPDCPPLYYREPSEAQQRAAARIKRRMEALFGEVWSELGEARFRFVEELSALSYSDRRDPGARPVAGEIDLSSGWRLETAGDAAAEAAAARLRRYLREAMGVTLEPGPAQRTGGVIRFERKGTDSGQARFRVEVSRSEVRLRSPSPEGLLRAVYWLQGRLDARGGPFLEAGVVERREVWSPRYIYPFFALYGDPLFEPEADPLPEGYLDRLGRLGVNGVWIQAVLNTLAPSAEFPEFGKGWQVRLRNLNSLVERAARYGIRIYLYLNEPRAMPAEFFERHPEIRGSFHRGVWAMCTSVPKVRRWIADSLEHVAREAPGIGGFFTISMSENHTNCFSHGGTWGSGAPNAGDCPRCSKRKSWDVLAELLNTMRDGVRRSNAEAKILHWDWGWGDRLAEELIPRLAKDVLLLSVSEWGAPVDRGFPTRVREYSISVVGPGPRARRNWARARRAGLETAAKVQFNNTWEIAAVPYIPVLQLVCRHCENLSRERLQALMASWTIGGYPSPNLATAQAFYSAPRPGRDEILRRTAAAHCGPAAAERLVEAWDRFSRAFREFPYGVNIYLIPTNHGPANLLRLDKVEHPPGMILFPHDAWRQWVGPYPPEVVERQFRKMAGMWAEGLPLLEEVLARTPSQRRGAAELELAVARTCWRHFRSVANQLEFYRLRERLNGAGSARLSGPERDAVITRMQEIARDEIRLAREQFVTARSHSVIAYEASNHYFYTPFDLAEKCLNAEYVIEELEARRRG